MFTDYRGTMTLKELTERERVNTVKAAELAGVSERTIWNWMRQGRIDYIRTPTSRIRIYVDSLLSKQAMTRR